MDNNENKKTFAVLIDADNVSPERFERIFGEISLWGIATYRRIYGNWAEYNRSALKEKLVEFALTPVQQFNYIKGKNATDIAMVIDAMDILYTGKVDGFAIVTNDSDFTRLALRLRESGMTVIGMGDDVAPASFRAACTDFIVLRESRRIAEELTAQKKLRLAARKPVPKSKTAALSDNSVNASEPLRADAQPDDVNAPEAAPDEAEAVNEPRKILSDRELRDAIREFLYGCTEDEGWFSASTMLNRLMQKFPDLDIKDYADLPLFAGKRKIWTTYFLSLGFLESKQKGPSNYCLRLKFEERRRLDVERGQAADNGKAMAEGAGSKADAVDGAVNAVVNGNGNGNAATEAAANTNGNNAAKTAASGNGNNAAKAAAADIATAADAESKPGQKGDTKSEAKAKGRIRARRASKSEAATEAKAEAKAETKAEAKAEAGAGSKAKAEPKAEIKAEAKAETGNAEKTDAPEKSATGRRTRSKARSAASNAKTAEAEKTASKATEPEKASADNASDVSGQPASPKRRRSSRKTSA